MRAICCIILALVFFLFTKSKTEKGTFFMDKLDTFFANLWMSLCYVSIIAAVILCCLGL